MSLNSASAIVIYDRKVVLILRDDIPTISNPGKWNLPGGKVEMGESFEEGVKRELEEEICHTPRNLKYLGQYSIPWGFVALYVAYLEKSEVLKVKLGNEGQRLGFFSFEEISKLELTGASATALKIYGPRLNEILEGGETALEKLDPKVFGLKQ